MYEKQEDIFYYLTVMNENYVMPVMPKLEGIKEGILKGLYKFKKSDKKDSKIKAHLFGSGSIMNEVIKAGEILESNYGVSTDIWSATSYKALHTDIMDVERFNMLNPFDEQKESYLQQVTKTEKGVFVAASDYVQIIKDAISKHLPGNLVTLGTYGFGRSEGRASLRDFFEVDAKHITYATLVALFKDGKIKANVLKQAIKDLGINPNKKNPHKS